MEDKVYKIRELLLPYLEHYRSWIGTRDFQDLTRERRNKSAQFQRLLTREKIPRISEADIRSFISSLWAFGDLRRRDYQVGRFFKANDLNEFRSSLVELLWSSKPLRQRYDKFEASVQYLGSASITEILSLVHQKDCAIWNTRSRIALGKIGITLDLSDEYWISGHDYETICGEYKNIMVALLEEHIDVRDLLDVDLFLYWVSVTEKLDIDINTAILFLSFLEEDIMHVIENPELLQKELRDLVKPAWSEVQWRIRDAVESLEKGGARRFKSRLDAVGLTGKQLEWKMTGYKTARKKYFESRPRLPRIYRHVLKWLNIILGSLSKVLPILEAVKEYKESIEAGLIE